jgi:hypothetical protein
MINLKRLIILSTFVLGMTIEIAQAEGNYIPGSDTTFSNLRVGININCHGSTPIVRPFANIIASTNNPSADGVSGISKTNGGSIEVLAGQLTDVIADRDNKIQLIEGNIIQLRNNINDSWFSVGTIAESDITNYCNAYNAWIAIPAPRPNYSPSNALKLTLLPGMNLSVSRSAESSLCFIGLFATTAHRNLDYTFLFLNTDGESLEMNSQIELTFGSSRECRNWSESPWVETH